MNYQILTLDLDGTLTNSKKEISPDTRQAIFDVQARGKTIVLASGRPTYGVLPLAKDLGLDQYGGYVLGFNGGQITECRSGKLLCNRTLPPGAIRPVFELVKKHPDACVITYHGDKILAGMTPNDYANLESRINHMPIRTAADFPAEIHFPVNKLLVTGEPDDMAAIEEELKRMFHSALSIYRSDPFFVEVMPPRVDKAYSLHRLVTSIGLRADDVICCGDGYNDVTMIEYAGLGVAMENAQPIVRKKADYITKSNDEDGVLHVIRTFMQK